MMRQLSELDASFLYLESESSPMHIGGLYLFDSSDRESPLTFEEFHQYIGTRLHRAGFFRQRLMEVPFGLDQPYWVDDPEFSLDRHLRHITLEQPGNESQLLRLTANLLAEPLPRDRPLWEISFIDGIEPSTDTPAPFALVVKVHHAAIDAVSGEEVMETLLDFSPRVRRTSLTHPWTPEPLPSRLRLLGNAYSSALTTPFRLAGLARDTVASAFYAVLMQRLQKLNLPPVPFSAPKTRFNHPVSAERVLGYRELPLERLKKLKQQHPSVNLNDLVMTLCSEALRAFLSRYRELPARPLLALSPVSVRSNNLRSPIGKQMSVMLVSLATNEPDLARRLKKIHDNAVASKVYGQAISATRLTQLIPSSLIGLSARLYSEFQLAQRHRPLFNLPITNIPGPQTPLYLNGSRLIRQIGSAPLFDGMGLILTAVSYHHKLAISATSCPDLVSNLNEFLDELPLALDQLEKALEGVDLTRLPESGARDGQTVERAQKISGGIRDVGRFCSSLFDSFRSRDAR